MDIANQKVVVTGDFDEDKLLKKIKKKMRKRMKKMEKKKQEEETLKKYEESNMNSSIYMNPSSDEEKEMARYMMFSDDNPNACSIS